MNSKIDQNGRPSLIALASDDGSTIIPINANNNVLMVDDGNTGNDNGGGENANIDENSISTMTAASSDNDGSIVNLYIDPISKKLLIQSN